MTTTRLMRRRHLGAGKLEHRALGHGEQHVGAVGSKGNAVDGRRRLNEANGLNGSGGEGEEEHGAVLTHGGEGAAVGGEGKARDGLGVGLAV